MQLSMLIPMMVVLPLLSGAALLLLPSGGKAIKAHALIGTLATLGVSLLVVCRFDWSESQAIQMASAIGWVEGFGLSFGFGIDAISLWLVLLTTVLMPLVVLGSFSSVTHRFKEFYGWLMVLEAAMIGTFVATDLIFFYICFEFTLVPLYLLIGVFGGTQRLRAAKMFFLYTFTGSMLTFAGVLYVAWFNTTLPWTLFEGAGRWTFDIRTLYGSAQAMSHGQQVWVLIALLSGFAVKVPLFPVHTWLPLAHTEAPTSGSVILAGVLLKLGTYGLLRFALPMTPWAVVTIGPYIGAFAVAGILYTALICWVQKDIKKLIAYSSVSHLGFCVLGMFALNSVGVGGSILYMINHGLSTGALFLCVGMIYERMHTREMSRMGGLARIMPVWAFFMVFFCMASVGLPGLNGFVGEFLTLMGAFVATDVLGPAYAAIAGVGMILGAIYVLYMVGRVVFGPVVTLGPSLGDPSDGHGVRTDDLNWREIGVLSPLAVGCLWLGLFPTTVLQTLEAPIEGIIEPTRSILDGGVYGKGVTIDSDSERIDRDSDFPAARRVLVLFDTDRIAQP